MEDWITEQHARQMYRETGFIEWAKILKAFNPKARLL